jgi:hypothetical protein
MYRVKIKRLPQARFGRGVKTGQQMDGALAIQPTAMGGADIDQYIGEKPLKTVNTLSAVPREEANLEAEGGETAYGDLNGDGMAEHAKIVGPRHHSGGVPLNLPDDTFIYSDTSSMKIKDPKILSMFGKATAKGKKSKGFTPAELAKQYDLNKYRKILQDPNSDKIDKKTAELMIQNYTMKLGALALAQESKKGFPQGIPVVAQPYMDANKISEQDIMPTYKSVSQGGQQQQADQMYEQEQEGMPTEMPNGEPIAMSPEMQGQEQPMPPMESMPPMAQYGMMMGGYDMPYYPEMAYGGIPRFNDGGRKMTTAELQAKAKKDAAKKVKEVPAGYENIGGGYYATGTINQQEVESGLGTAKPGSGGGGRSVGYERTMCDELRRGVTPEQLAAKGHGTAAGLKNRFKDCYEEGKAKLQQGSENIDVLQLEEPTDTPCNPCPDGSVPPRTPDGKCPCEEKKCNACPDGTVPEMTADGKCPCGETTETTETTDTVTPPQPTMTAAGWTAPDIRNYYGAFKDKYSLNRYYPWAARADLEEPTNILYDPTRELAQQSEQTNILTQGLGQFAGPQALSARASQIQGNAAQQAADTLSRYNNLNVGLENQFALTQNQIRNQEKMLNQATAKELYDKTMMTKQQYDNAKRQADANVRQSFATGWKNASDIAMLNSMQEQYKVDPYSGTVFHTGVGKTPTTDKPSMSPTEYWNSPELRGLTDKAKETLVAKKFSTGKYGGNMKDGGIYVMGSNVFPFMFY